MDAWHYLVRAAVLGSERQAYSLPNVDGEVGALLEGCSTATAEEAMLTSAAALGTWQAAGVLPAEAPEVESLPALEPEEWPVLTPAAAGLLARILEGAAMDLREAIARMAEQHLIVPPALLPRFLNRALHLKELRPQVRAIMGRRGVALARLRSEWQPLLGATDARSAWEEGNLEVRRAYLAESRRVDPAQARELLGQCWKSEPANHRSALLGTLAEGLSNDDEAWLESCLDDRSSEVRDVARELLSRLADSAFATRMNNRVRAIISSGNASGGDRDLDVKVAFDERAKRDGLEQASGGKQKVRGKGAQAHLLIQLAMHANLDAWGGALDASPAEVIQRLSTSIWINELRAGWLVAAHRQQNTTWARALFQHESARPDPTDDFHTLLEVLPIGERESLALQRIRSNRDPRETGLLILACGAPASRGMTEALAEIVISQLELNATANARTAVELFTLMCRHGDPTYQPTFAERVAPLADQIGNLGVELLDRFSQYQFRHDFHRETES